MKVCRRRRLSYVAMVVISMLLVGLSTFCAYDVFWGNSGSTGDFAMMVAGFILFSCTAIYLMFFTIAKWKNYISYDEHSVVFHFEGNEERRVSWVQMRSPEVTLKWMDTDVVIKKIIRFAFEDGKTLDISALAFEGYKELYEMMRKQGVLERYNLNEQAMDMLKEMFDKEINGSFEDSNYERRVIGSFTIVKQVKPKDD